MPTPFDSVYEILAKEIVYGFNNPQFTQEVNQFLGVSGYQIDQTFIDPATGFQALGLISIAPNRPPVLLFRGTDELIDDIANADPRGIGFNQFSANQDAIATWLNKFSAAPLKPDLVGHSMGGALAQTFASQFVGQYGNVVTFNSPGVDNDTVKAFQDRSGNAQTVTHYIVNGDLVSLGGEGFIPGAVVLQSYTENEINPIFALDKHREINRLLLTPPEGYSQTTIPVETLSSGTFNFNQDPDFAEFFAAYQAVQPDIAATLTSRATVEALRISPGFSFLGLILGARALLAPDLSNFLLGNASNNTANGRGGADRIFGEGGDDILEGGSGNDQVSGGDGNDRLFGNAGNDLLIGGLGSDRLVGGDDRDVLIGVNPEVPNAGQGEIDRLKGGSSKDRFVLGDSTRAYYNDGRRRTLGNQDFALILDFERGDRIQLHGSIGDYRLETIGQRTRILLETGRQDELIGAVQGVSDLGLIQRSFRFV
ncbi:MAG: hypothetical protein MUF49_16540 [Oculatellaceae cyanobacterium Prado106]|jgi:Ca2+-binding RTX toxin-like protein|nr:hypothetical protein [Oculatellaceae cyanobacterium Prado106]